MIFSKFQEHFYMEPHAALAIPHGEKDEMTVWATSQDLNAMQLNIARVLKIPMNKVRVVTRRLGGGFGGKERLIQSGIIASVAARKSGRPCRCRIHQR